MATIQIVRHALRRLIRSPSFTVTVAGALAVGIGLATAVFTVANAVLIRPLPVRDQARLVVLYGETGDARFSNFPLSVREFHEFADRSRSLAQVAHFAYYGAAEHTLVDGASTVRLRRALVSGNFFGVLGTPAAIGRALRPDDDIPGAAPSIVLSHRAWLQRFGGDSTIVGRTMTVYETGRSVTIVGVMAPGLDYPGRADYWAPLTATSSGTVDSLHITSPMLDVIARLRPGATVDEARAELSAFFQRPEMPASERNVRGVANLLPDLVVGDERPTILTLGAVAALLLLLACVNVANLLLVRGMDRAREMVVRTALGAGRGRIVRELLAESAVLAALGGTLGAATAFAAVAAFRAIAPPGLARIDEVAPDATLLFVAIGVATISLTIFSVFPALISSRVDAGEVLRTGGRSVGGARGVRAATEWLVVTQVAFAAVALSAAGLTARSLLRLQDVDLAYEPHHLLVAELAARTDRPTSMKAQIALFDAIAARVRALPGVEAATPVIHKPFAGHGFGIDGLLMAPGQSAEQVAANPILSFEIVAPDYFATLGAPMVRGRPFNEGDRAGAPPVVIVSRETAAHFWPGVDPLGKVLIVGGKSKDSFLVVGVAADTRYRDLRVSRPTVYFPEAQSFFPVPPRELLVRTTGSESDVVPALRRVVGDYEADVTLVSAVPFETLLEDPRAVPRMTAVLLATFAGTAVLLAAVGIFAVIAAGLNRRRRELGVRMALGATGVDASRLIIGRGLMLASAGVVIGVAISIGVGRMMSALLFEVTPTDVPTLVGVSATLIVVAVAASALPAFRASRVDPMVALRAE